LDGFAEAHFIGEQHAFTEGEVQHSLALIRVERAKRDVLRVAAFDHAGFVIATQGEAFPGATAGFEEMIDVLGDTDFRTAAKACQSLGGVGAEGAIGSKKRAKERRE
jgi:hypothetical protein